MSKPFEIDEIKNAINNAVKKETPDTSKSVKILVIDDSPETSKMLDGVFEEDFEIENASDGESGLE